MGPVNCQKVRVCECECLFVFQRGLAINCRLAWRRLRPETAGIGFVKPLRPWLQVKASEEHRWMGCLWLQLNSHREGPESNRKNCRLKGKQRIQLTPGRCGKSQNVTSVVFVILIHPSVCKRSTLWHVFFIPHEISLMNIEMLYWNFQCRNIPQHSASPCSRWTVFFFSWFVMVTFRATILPNNSCVNISSGCERYLQLIAHSNDAHSLVNTMAMKKACGHFDPKHSICAENALDHLDWMLWTVPQVLLSSAPRSCFLSRLPRVSILHYSRLLYKGCVCSSSVLLR